MRAGGAEEIVIGAGVTGLSAAWWLARDGVDTLVLDAGQLGWGASGRNGGAAVITIVLCSRKSSAYGP
jgi:sarcosine oxidase, subunit beta